VLKNFGKEFSKGFEKGISGEITYRQPQIRWLLRESSDRCDAVTAENIDKELGLINGGIRGRKQL
jgi:hypothetical protein